MGPIGAFGKQFQVSGGLNPVDNRVRVSVKVRARFRVRIRIRVRVSVRVGVRVRVRDRVRVVIKPIPLSRYPIVRKGILFGGPAMEKSLDTRRR